MYFLIRNFCSAKLHDVFHTFLFLCFLCLFVASSGARYFLRLIFLTAFFPEDLLVFSFTVFLTGFFATFLTFAFTTFLAAVFLAAFFAGLAVSFGAGWAA